MSVTRIIVPYSPRPLQRLVHKERKRYTLLLTHRRFGKTVCAVCDLLRRALKYGHTRRAWRAGYVAPFLKQAKKNTWDYLKYYAGAVPGASFNESELRCDLPNGARISIDGADNPKGLRGGYFDDLVIDEAADISRSFWTLVLRPMLADRRGWVMFTGTPQGMNNLLYDVYQQALASGGHRNDNAEKANCTALGTCDSGNVLHDDMTAATAAKGSETWALFVFKASETGYIEVSELEQARKDMSEDEYNQEFECSFAAAVRGAYWSREIDALESEGRIGQVPFEPELEVYTAWDLGMDDAMCIWFFQIERGGPSGQWRVFDYYEYSGEGLEHYADIILCRNPQHWSHGQTRRYARHIGPHDIMVRELGTGKSRFEVARSFGIRFTPCRNLPVIDGINAVRRQLPHCRFDAERCREGLLALRQYRKSYNEKMDMYGKPVHDWTSHPSDAFRYAVVGMMPPREGRMQERTINRKPRY